MRERLIRIGAVMEVTGLSRSRIYQFIGEGRFPASVSLGGRAVAWVESEVQQWVEGMIGRRCSDTYLYSFD
jgi:prophage regulatory protein